MFNGIGLTKGLSFAKVIGGLSRTLQIANQIIPLYQKAKPAIANARNMLGILKTINAPEIKETTEQIPEDTSVPDEIIEKEKTPTAPTFFL